MERTVMAVRRKKKKPEKSGQEFEVATMALLRLFPGASLEHQSKLAGKKVDNYCVIASALMPPFRIAIECKDWARPLTRKQTAVIISEYLPLLDSSLVEQFLLVTRNGIVPDAKVLFDGRRLKHLTYSELAEQIMDPTSLVDDMIRQYSRGGLSGFYVEQKILAPNLSLAKAKFDLIYNEFVDFALESGADAFNLSAVKRAWVQYFGSDLKGIIRSYSQNLFEEVLWQRRNQEPLGLEDFIEQWLGDDDTPNAIAILGSYGTGKSILARRLAYVCAKEYRKGNIDRIPFLIELKEFGSHQDVAGLITHELVNRHRVANGSFHLFQSLNEAGRILLILDGFDEMKEGMTADALIYNFHQLASLHLGGSKILLCGRPTVFENTSEQSRLLRGDIRLEGAHPARYVQASMVPFDIEDVCDFLLRYTKVCAINHYAKIATFVRDLRKEVVHNKDLYSLVSRPVHLPMLVSVVPRLNVKVSAIKRSDLYGEFIDAIIEREMLKRKPEFQKAYTVEARRKFAIGLAVEMWRKGEVRSIRTAEIPQDFIASFGRPGVPLEATRRDLVTACFLEIKPPDILFMPHKSFVEYLVAEYIVDLLNNPQEIVLLQLTSEVYSFITEMAEAHHWFNAMSNASNAPFLVAWLNWVRSHKYIVKHEVEEVWDSCRPLLGQGAREAIVLYYESASRKLSGAAIRFLKFSLADLSNVVAVHAYRALLSQGKAPSAAILFETLGQFRFIDWLEMGWVKADAKIQELMCRQLVLRLIMILRIRQDELANAKGAGGNLRRSQRVPRTSVKKPGKNVSRKRRL